MLKDKYLKESLNTKRLNELAQKYNLGEYIPGQTFDSAKGNMSAEDYDTSQKLLDYYTTQKNLTDNYNYNINQVNQNRDRNLQSNAISKEMTMKYLPDYLKLQGLGGLGVSESAVISANNNFRNARNTINADAESQRADLLNNYQGKMAELDDKSTSEMGSIRDKYEAIHREETEQKKNLIDNFYRNEMLTNPDYYTEDGTKLTEDGKNKIKKYLEDNKDVLGTMFDTYSNELDARNVYTNEEKAKAEKDDLIKKGKEFFNYDGTDYRIKGQLTQFEMELFSKAGLDMMLKARGYADIYSPKIPNGTTIKVDNDGGAITFYDGQWYASEKR